MTAPVPDHASLPVAELQALTATVVRPLFYGGEDDEHFHATSAEEYIVDRYDWGVLDKLVESDNGLVVVAYRAREVTQKWIEQHAERLLETLIETYEEEFGGEDDCFRRGKQDWSPAAERLAKFIREFTTEYLRPWQCEEESRRTYSREEVLAILGPAPAAAANPEPVKVVTFEKRERS